MKYLRPGYYDRFICTAGDCVDTCCQGWAITIDSDTIKKYKNLHGPFANRLHNAVDSKSRTFIAVNNRCSMLNDDNLCDICLEASDDLLCKTCRVYPRHMEDYPMLREVSLSLSCPEAARIILTAKDWPRYHTTVSKKTEDIDRDFDSSLYEKLEKLRTICYEVIQDEEFDVEEKMDLLLAFAHQLQKNRNLISLNKEQKKALCEKIRSQKSDKQGEKLRKQQLLVPASFLAVGANKIVPKRYLSNEQFRHRLFMLTNPVLHLLEYYLYVELKGAVYDGRILTKMKMFIVNVLFVISFAEDDSVEAFVTAAYQYARQIENEDKNRMILEQALETDEAFCLKNIYSAY